MRNEELESRIFDFEQAWQKGTPRDISSLMHGPPELAAEERMHLLIELVCIDLEFRWRACPNGQPTQNQSLLEAYAARYPELGPFGRLPLEIIGQEYRVRRQWGDCPAHSDILSRFPVRKEEIHAELARIDTELREESAFPRGNSLPLAGPLASEIEIGQSAGFPLIPHHDVLLLRMIGSGRTGKVYEAWQHSAHRPVAVKFLRKSYLHDPGVVQRFVAEAEIIARLRHPNIVGIHGLGRTPAGAYFIVMQLVAGSSLDLVTKARPISVAESVRWVSEACHALDHAHSNGIIHCDLKPANLLLDRDGGIFVTDFGLSRSLSGNTLWTAEIEGTAPYMAPEQASRYWGQVDVRTDVYGLGAVLFTLLTGRPPWVGRRLPDVLAHVISASPVIPPTDLRPELPETLSNICRKCLSKPQADRYPTVQQVRSALTEIMGANG
jgi:tRNA A-37 threonylcarbamoyl transferase component Bud32